MNIQTFDFSKPTGRKHFNNLISMLLEYNLDSENDDYYDIRVHPEDCQLVTVEWGKAPWGSNEWGGSFKWMESCDEVYTEVGFPDDHYEMVPKGTENEALSDWLKEHPEWETNNMGMWTNVEKNRQFVIDLNVPDWAKRQEREDDSTFKEYEFPGKVTCCKEAISSVGGDVLHRTGYIVAGNDFLDVDDCEASCLNAESAKRKYGECTPAGNAEFEYEWSDWRKEPTTERASIPVYICEECNGMALYLTDSNYLIARLRPQCNHGDSKAKEKEEAQ